MFLFHALKLINSSCELLHHLIQGIGEDKEDELEDKPFGGDGMDFLWEKAGDA